MYPLYQTINSRITGFIILAAVTLALPLDPDRISLNGFVSFEAEQQIDAIGLGDPNFSLDADLLDLIFNFQIGENMRTVCDISWKHGHESSKNYGALDLEYVFIEHTFFDEIKLRIGKILTPFGNFNEILQAKPAYYSVDVPLSAEIVKQFAPTSFLFFPKSGMGISIQGETVFQYTKSLEYHFFVANGLQDSSTNPYEMDGNISKSIAAQLRFSVTDNIKVGKSIYIDNPVHPIHRLIFSDGYEFEFNNGKFRLLSELTIGNLYKDKDITENSQVTQAGAYIQPSFSFESGLTPYFRFDILDPDIKLDDNYSFVTTLGIHYELSNWYMVKSEVDYFHFGKKSQVPQLSDAGYTTFKAALVLGF